MSFKRPPPDTPKTTLGISDLMSPENMPPAALEGEDDDEIHIPTAYRYVKPQKRVKGERPTYGIRHIRPGIDHRDPAKLRGAYNEDLLNSLVNVILNHKKEVKKVPTAMTWKGAQKYAAQRKGFSAAMVDMNPGDGLDEEEVVVYNKAGVPVIINGYKLTPSRFPYRRDYEEAKDESGFIGDERINMREWRKRKYGYKPGTNLWDDSTLDNETVNEFEKYADSGYAKLPKPPKSKSVYQIFCKLLAPAIKQAYASKNYTILNKLLSPLMVCQLAYIIMVAQEFAKDPQYNINSYEQFTNYVKTKSGAAKLKEWFLQTYIDNGQFTIDAEDIGKLFATTMDTLGNGQTTVFAYITNDGEVQDAQRGLVNQDGSYRKFDYNNKQDIAAKRAFDKLKAKFTNKLKFVIAAAKGDGQGMSTSQIGQASIF